MSERSLKKLEATRERMIKSALEKGVLSNETIKLSKELDRLLNNFQQINEDEDLNQKE